MKLRHSILALSLIGLSAHSNSANYSYVEVGAGASQLHSFDKTDNENLSDLSLGGAGKAIVGGRIGRSANAWFELGYNYNNGISYQDFSMDSQTILAGIKLTTNPSSGFSSFLKAGVARSEYSYHTTGQASDTEFKNLGYAGLGLSFRLDTRQAINLEVQRFIEKGTATGLNSVFFTFKHSI